MIISDKEAAARLDSPMNLINRMRSVSSNSGNGNNGSNSRSNAMGLFGLNKNNETVIKKVFNPFENESRELATTTNQTKEPQPQQIERSSDSNANGSIESSNTPSEASINQLISNNEVQIKLGLAHDNAVSLLHDSVEALSIKLQDVKADKLPSVIAAASKVVESIRRERSEATKNGKGQEVHYHFYTPIPKKIDDFEVIEVG